MALRSDVQRAFTLLELLVAMTLMSIIAASLYTSLSIGFKARETSESAVEKSRSLEIALELLEEEIISALPPTGILAGQFEGLDEEDDYGYDADSLVFYSANHVPNEDEKGCDIRKVELKLSVREDSDERVLVRELTTNLLSPKSLNPDEEVLCGGVKSLNLRYYDGYDWQDEWDSADKDNALPKAVEISIALEADSNEQEQGYGYKLTQAIVLPCS